MQNWDVFLAFLLAYLLVTWRIENARDRILKRLDDLEAKLDEIESKQDSL